jgi:hypothetical protein
VCLMTQPQLLTPLLKVIHRVIATFLIKRAGLKRRQADTGAVTLIQRFGSAANLNIHLHCLVLDGVYQSHEGVPVFDEVAAPTIEEPVNRVEIQKANSYHSPKFLSFGHDVIANRSTRRERLWLN